MTYQSDPSLGWVLPFFFVLICGLFLGSNLNNLCVIRPEWSLCKKLKRLKFEIDVWFQFLWANGSVLIFLWHVALVVGYLNFANYLPATPPLTREEVDPYGFGLALLGTSYMMLFRLPYAAYLVVGSIAIPIYLFTLAYLIWLVNVVASYLLISEGLAQAVALLLVITVSSAIAWLMRTQKMKAVWYDSPDTEF